VTKIKIYLEYKNISYATRARQVSVITLKHVHQPACTPGIFASISQHDENRVIDSRDFNYKFLMTWWTKSLDSWPRWSRFVACAWRIPIWLREQFAYK